MRGWSQRQLRGPGQRRDEDMGSRPRLPFACGSGDGSGGAHCDSRPWAGVGRL